MFAHTHLRVLTLPPRSHLACLQTDNYLPYQYISKTVKNGSAILCGFHGSKLVRSATPVCTAATRLSLFLTAQQQGQTYAILDIKRDTCQSNAPMGGKPSIDPDNIWIQRECGFFVVRVGGRGMNMPLKSLHLSIQSPFHNSGSWEELGSVASKRLPCYSDKLTKQVFLVPAWGAHNRESTSAHHFTASPRLSHCQTVGYY